MKTSTKALILTICAVFLVVCSVFVTMAYLTSSTDIVRNTFTFGNVSITLDEAKVGDDGVAFTPAERVTENEYKLIPAHMYTKDPTIHVSDDSEDCWIFVKLENGLVDIIAEPTIESQMSAIGWSEIDTTNHIFAYKNIVEHGDDIKVFENFKLTNDCDLSEYDANTAINIIGYAVQADGFETASAAWTSAFSSGSSTN